MKSEKQHNLPDFVRHNGITTAFGSVVATAVVNETTFALLMKQLHVVHFYAVFLLIDGEAEVCIDGQNVRLEQHSILRTSPMQHTDFVSCSNAFEGRFLFVEATFYDDMVENDDNLRDAFALNLLNTCFYKTLNEMQTSEFVGIITQIERTIGQPHAYKKEMLGFLIHLMQMHIRELIGYQNAGLHDMKHKENIFKIFIHLASNHFKQQRQINFYADRMNITSTYLSRIVKEVSGNTVNGYLQSFLYGEACKLLQMADKTIGEIAFELHFSDQSAFTNFFKQRSGMSPKAYKRYHDQPNPLLQPLYGGEYRSKGTSSDDERQH